MKLTEEQALRILGKSIPDARERFSNLDVIVEGIISLNHLMLVLSREDFGRFRTLLESVNMEDVQKILDQLEEFHREESLHEPIPENKEVKDEVRTNRINTLWNLFVKDCISSKPKYVRVLTPSGSEVLKVEYCIVRIQSVSIECLEELNYRSLVRKSVFIEKSNIDDIQADSNGYYISYKDRPLESVAIQIKEVVEGGFRT